MDNVQSGLYSLREKKSFAYGKAHSENLLIHGDSEIVLELLREKYSGKMDCIYMDPPYCSGTKNEHYADIFCWEEYLKMMKNIITSAFELLSEKGFLFVQMGRDHACAVRGLIESVFGNANFRNEIIIKRDDHKTYADRIHHLASGYDVIFLFSKNPSAMLPAPRKMGAYATDNWSDLAMRGNDTDFEHEVNKEMVRRIVSWITEEGDFLLDPFLGSGTSAVAAAEMNRRWIGIEREQYCSTEIRDRINKTIDEMDSGNDTAGYRFLELKKDGQ